MPRPRVHDLDAVLDAAERLAVSAGPAAVTIRALSEATTMSNGALYHAFGSRAALLARAWVRAAQRFLQLQRDGVDLALGAHTGTAVDAVVAAALCPATFLDRSPASAQLLLTVSRDELLRSAELPAGAADDLRRLDDALGELFARLSDRLWGRIDRPALALVRTCVVELPTALLLRGNRTADPDARLRLEAAVRAVLSIPPVHP
ncbi:AcrR family transcriptional regulator [Mycolicibacterium iranicum]|uniref:AcrR family transcriptional regulator n=1 Tax=Mycolicibacterium iranicum TaxID=912594 RepID=A0A839PYN3_MYCIR|nr:TetR/AcrR family transcriptional regulator [Mycolicibacterium iranicum]MBB2989120.1 AcrR family transcriptional regulator [Mycolicibacterium iranicum]